MSVFETARALHLPGVCVEKVYIDPTQLTPRMKNMVQRMLRNGYTVGGRSSQSKRLAVKLAETFKIPLLELYRTSGITLPEKRAYAEHDVDRLVELIDTSEMLGLLDAQERWGGGAYVNERKEMVRQDHDEMRARVRGDDNKRWLQLANEDIATQAMAVLVRARGPKALDEVERVCDMLDRGEAIPITLTK